jgi:hypothetical protein
LVPAGKVGYVCQQDEQEIANSIQDFYTAQRESTFARGVEEEKAKFTWEYLTQQLFSI